MKKTRVKKPSSDIVAGLNRLSDSEFVRQLNEIPWETWGRLSKEDRDAITARYENTDDARLVALREEYWNLKNHWPSTFGMQSEELIQTGREHIVARIFKEPTEAICLLRHMFAEGKPVSDAEGHQVGYTPPPKKELLERAKAERPDLFSFLGKSPRKEAIRDLWLLVGMNPFLSQARGYGKSGP